MWNILKFVSKSLFTVSLAYLLGLIIAYNLDRISTLEKKVFNSSPSIQKYKYENRNKEWLI